MLLPLEIVTNGRRNTETPSGGEVSAVGNDSIKSLGIKELACGSQAPIATLLFDPSMSALPILRSQKGAMVGLFTH